MKNPLALLLCAMFALALAPGVAFADDAGAMPAPDATPSVEAPAQGSIASEAAQRGDEAPSLESALQAGRSELAEKGSPCKVAEGTYQIVVSSKRGISLSSPGTREGAQLVARKGGDVTDRKIYVRNEGDGLVSLQSVSSGLFIGESGGRIVQLPDGEGAGLRWKPLRDGGIKFVNARSGNVLSLAGGKAKAGSRAVSAPDEGSVSQRWRLTKAKLVEEGCYRVVSAKGERLGVAGGSYAIGGNIASVSGRVQGSQVFYVRGAGAGRYTLENTRSFLVMGVSGNSVASGANVVQQKRVRTASQLWKPQLDRSGYLRFMNAKSGKALEVAGSSKKAGSNVRQRVIGKSPGQLWKLVKAKRYSLSGDGQLDRTIASILRNHTTLRAAYDHVALDYRYISANEIRGGRYLSKAKSIAYAKEFARNKGGNCYRYSSMMSWLARGLGYSSRVVTGWVPGVVEPHAPHGWCEVRAHGKTYVCDPDMYNAVRYRDWYMQTYESAPVAYGFW